MAFRLFVDSLAGLTVEPEWDYRGQDRKVEDMHRTRTGGRYVYRWGGYGRDTMTVRYVTSEFASIINSWWDSNTKLLWKNESDTNVFSVLLVNKELPVGQFVRPYTDLYLGKIELETY